MQSEKVPFFLINAASCLLIALFVGICLLGTKAEIPSRNAWKWLSISGLFGYASFISSASAVQFGAPLGDIASLTSINIVVAAFLGRAFLGEMLYWVHVVALCCSVVGAFLISSPGIVFGGSSTDLSSLVGYALATFSGFCGACIWVALRKAEDSSPAVFTLVVSTQGALMTPVFLCTGILPDYPLQIDTIGPLRLVAWLVTMVLVTLSAMSAGGTGARLCPAAVSATVSTCTKMICGYVAQTILFDTMPQPLTLLGAVSMLAGVAVMTVARLPQPVVAASAEADSATDSNTVDTTNVDDEVEADETDSFASFISAELVEFALHEKPVRQRRLPPNSNSGGEIIGAALGVLPIAV